MTELCFLGIGAAFYPQLGCTAAYFLHECDFYLIDCGDDVYRKVYGLKEYQNARRIIILITHMHTDHVGSLGSLIAYSYVEQHKKPILLYPDFRIKQYLSLCGISEEMYIYCSQWPGEESIGIEARSVIHDPCMGCYGYRITDGKEPFYYSGDSGIIGEDMVSELKSGKVKRLYLDTAKYAQEDSGHGNFSLLKDRIEPEWRRRVYCMHLDCDFRQEIQDAEFQNIKF